VQTVDATTPPQAANDHDAVRQRWSINKRMAFKVMAPACLALIATDGPVSVSLWDGGQVKHRFGHNRGVWPAKIAKGSVWKDTATAMYDKNPFFFLGAQFRVWCRTEADRDLLAAGVIDLIAARAESEGGLDPLINGFQDLGDTLDLNWFELEIHDIATRKKLTAWDDEGLSRFLDRVTVRAQAIAASAPRGKFDPIEVAIVKELEGGR
jgi:hypothetical protein